MFLSCPPPITVQSGMIKQGYVMSMISSVLFLCYNVSVVLCNFRCNIMHEPPIQSLSAFTCLSTCHSCVPVCLPCCPPYIPVYLSIQVPISCPFHYLPVSRLPCYLSPSTHVSLPVYYTIPLPVY